MPRGSGAKKKAKDGQVGTLKLMNVALILIVAGLVVYIMWPTISLAVKGQPLGGTTASINNPLSSSQLSVINNAPDSYFEQAGEMMLNDSIQGEAISNNIYYSQTSDFQIGLIPQTQIPQYTYDGKPSVIYIGAISCVWCGESRWAMALALSRFGSFNSLYIGYSSIHDSDVPTLYWKPQPIHVNDSATFGNFYSSPYVNFYSAEYDSNISSGFEFPTSADPISYFVIRAPNSTYEGPMRYMNATQDFSGTPFTLWGTVINKGASGVVFGTPENASVADSSSLPLTYMTHQQIFNQLGALNTTFAVEEYAAADVYVAQLCPSINNSAPVCSLPAIQTYEKEMGLA